MKVEKFYCDCCEEEVQDETELTQTDVYVIKDYYAVGGHGVKLAHFGSFPELTKVFLCKRCKSLYDHVIRNDASRLANEYEYLKKALKKDEGKN
jgi:hypothetical protein